MPNCKGSSKGRASHRTDNLLTRPDAAPRGQHSTAEARGKWRRMVPASRRADDGRLSAPPAGRMYQRGTSATTAARACRTKTRRALPRHRARDLAAQGNHLLTARQGAGWRTQAKDEAGRSDGTLNGGRKDRAANQVRGGGGDPLLLARAGCRVST